MPELPPYLLAALVLVLVVFGAVAFAAVARLIDRSGRNGGAR